MGNEKHTAKIGYTASEVVKAVGYALDQIDSEVDFVEHVKSTDNPHNVTSEQVGTYDKDTIDDLLSKKLDVTANPGDVEIDTYSKDEIDGLLGNKADTAYVDQQNAYLEFYMRGKSDIGHGHKVTEIDGVYSSEEVDEKLKNPSYEEDVSLVGITTEVGDIGAEITDNVLSGAGNSFHVNITGHIKFHCEVDKGGGWATVMDVELGGDTGVYEYSFEGVVEDGFEVYCSFAGVTFTEFVKKVYVKDAVGDINGKIGDIESALDELHNYATSLIGGEA